MKQRALLIDSQQSVNQLNDEYLKKGWIVVETCPMPNSLPPVQPGMYASSPPCRCLVIVELDDEAQRAPTSLSHGTPS